METVIRGSGVPVREGRQRVRLFEEDPDLLRSVRRADAACLMRDVTVPEAYAGPGPWTPPSRLCDERLLGLLVLGGLVIRHEEIIGACGVEILGRGDVLRPGQQTGAWESVPHEARWTVAKPASFAVLDRDFQLATAPWPEITVEIVRRAIDRSRWLAVRLALARARPLPNRVLTVLWQLADRWGHRRHGGVEVPLRISHALLADLACSERACITRALQELSYDGLVARSQPDGFWLLSDPPATPSEL